MPVYPLPNLDPNAAPWGRSVNQRLSDLENAAERKQQDDVNTNKQQNSTAQVLAGQIASISSVVNTLQAIANVQYGELGELGNFSGFYNGSRPRLTFTVPTGRVEIGYGGSLSGGSGYFCYSIVNADSGAVYISRDSVQQNGAQRVAVTGGASFAPSGYKTTVISVPAGARITVTLELFAQDTFVYFFGSSLLARVAP